jgi:hypothetical protein
MSEYCKNAYGVPAETNRIVIYKGDRGIITNKGGTYVSVNLDKNKPMQNINIHPTDENLIYTDEFGRPRKLTKSQQRYSDYLDSVYYEAGDSFAMYLGIKT